jgi:molecular chaperone DnaK
LTYVLGIDVGTTYTGAAVVRDGRVEVFPLGNRSSVVPTVVFLRDDQEILTGEAANRRALTEPNRVAREFKRRLGDTAPLLLGGTPLSPQALMGKMLRWTVDRVAEQQGEAPAHVAVSHPANWGPYKLDLLEQAVRLADLDSATTITEPEAAATYYASTQRLDPGQVVAVYDLGGGTFDAAVLRATELGFDILGSPEGIEHLGGIDIDEAVFAHVAAELGGALEQLDPDDPVALAAAARLRQECVEAKEALSVDREVTIPVLLPGMQTEVHLSRPQLEALVKPTLSATIDALRRALRSAEVTPDDLVAVLLVGGSSRMPMVAEMVGEALGRPVAVDTHPKHSVALGTALVADIASARIQGVTPEPVEVIPPRPTPPAPDELVAAESVPGPDSEPDRAAPPAQQTVAARSLADGPPPPPPGASPAEADTDGGAPGRRRTALLIGGPIAVVVVVALVVLALAGGGDDDPLETGEAAAEGEEGDEGGTTSTTPDATDTTSAGPPEVAVGASGRGVRIDSIDLDDGRYWVRYRTAGFEPLIADDPDEHHLHLFFDTVDPELAGTNTGRPDVGPWVLWDDPAVFDQYGPADRPDGADQICAMVADYLHRVELDTVSCWALPDG